MLIDKFFVDNREFSMYFNNAEFSLSLKKDYKEIIRKKDDISKLFWDDLEYDDVNENINVFSVMIESIKIICNYVCVNDISYFYFYASTERKAKIYKRLAKNICKKMSNDFDYVEDEGKFYFYKK